MKNRRHIVIIDNTDGVREVLLNIKERRYGPRAHIIPLECCLRDPEKEEVHLVLRELWRGEEHFYIFLNLILIICGVMNEGSVERIY